MNKFDGKVAVVTGGGTGIGRELCLQLVGEGCHVAICDVSEANMAETQSLCEVAAKGELRITKHLCDVSEEAQVNRFRDEVKAVHGDRVHLLFNNAGITGADGFIEGDRDEWEKIFNICWYGVYYNCRAFMPMILAADEAHIINTSSANGFFAFGGPGASLTAYSAAKFAVKGFSEALMIDFRSNAPHVGVSVVMPGHIGTPIWANSSKVHGHVAPLEMNSQEVAELREQMKTDDPMSELINMSDDQVRQAMHKRSTEFVDNAPTSAGEAATIILDGVRVNRWRILVGDDAQGLDKLVRANPEQAYELDVEALQAAIYE